MDKRNLLDETISVLNSYNYTEKDVKYVYDSMARTINTWEHFAEKAKNFNYNPGYGMEEVNSGLYILGDNWWLERAEYDGSEWWEFKTMPNIELVPVGDIKIKFGDFDNEY